MEEYIERITNLVFDQITKYFNQNNEDSKLIENHFTNRLINKRNFSEFQKFYFETLENTTKLKFDEFRTKYSILGVDKETIINFQKNKTEIIKLINEDKLSELYFKYFSTVSINEKQKSLGSFFTKIVHTFKPDKFSPLDMPMRNYFKLENESYFISLFVISNAFNKWSNNNKSRIENIRRELKLADKSNLLDHTRITNMKLLNIVFWSEADDKKTKSSR